MRKRDLFLTAIGSALLVTGFSAGQQEKLTDIGKVVLGIVNLAPTASSHDSFMVRNKYVNRYIKYFQGFGRQEFRNALSRSTRYLDTIKGIFKQYDVPGDLAYLAIIESGFNNNALSRVYATGMWQFMSGTGRGYGLKINRHVDERRDFFTASHAAARYLRDLYNQFGDWFIALAAYNAGGGYISRKVAATGAKNFWELLEKGNLYAETAAYVPKFIAARMMAMHPDSFGLKKIEYKRPIQVTRVPVRQGIRLSKVATIYDISIRDLRRLNPHIRGDYVPSNKKRMIEINLPSSADAVSVRPKDAAGKNLLSANKELFAPGS